jgi:predicted ester cyclase
MNTATTAIVRRSFECWNKRDFSVIAELFPNCIYHFPTTGELRGEAFRAYFTSLLNAFPDGRLTMLDQVQEDDKVVVRWSFTGTHRGELMGIAPTGKQVSFTGISIMRVAEGKIVEAWEEGDSLGMMQQLGLVPTINLEATVAV